MMRWIDKLLPRQYRAALRCARLLEQDFGHARSRREKACCNRQGAPLPWYTYPAIEYLDRLDFGGQRVFEFGSGNSTLFWSARAERIVSVEHDLSWYRGMVRRIDPRAVELQWLADGEDYVNSILDWPEPFDVIVIDGRFRAACALHAVRCLAPGGLIVLDNSDWHPRAAQILRDAGLIEVDLSGFGPINDYTWTTSLFLHRDFRPRFRSARHPLPGIGGLDQLADEDFPSSKAAA